MATSRKARGAKKAGIAVDFTGVETQVSLPEQDFLLEVEEIEQKTSDNSGADYLSFTFKIADGQFSGKKLWHNCSLQPQALFNLRGVLEALGLEVPSGAMELDPADLIGLQCGGAVQNETYEGKTKSRIVEFFPAEDLDGEEAAAEDEAPATKVKPAKGKKAAPEPEEPADDEGENQDGDDLTWEDVQEAEKEDLLELAADNEIKLTLKVKKDLQLMRDTICAALELEAPESEPEPEVKTPAKKGKAKKTKTLAVGSKVNFTNDEGEVLEGTVTEIEGDDATVDVDGEEWELEVSDLTLI